MKVLIILGLLMVVIVSGWLEHIFLTEGRAMPTIIAAITGAVPIIILAAILDRSNQ